MPQTISAIAGCLVLSLATAIPAFSDVIYDFSGVVNMFDTNQFFQYTATTFITADTFVPEASLDTCTSEGLSPCFGVNFLPSGPDTPEHFPEITFETANPDGSVGTVFYYFPLGSTFSDFGTLTTVPSLGNAGTLTIAPIPEPATWTTVLTGLMAFVAMSRRGRNRRHAR